MSHVYLPPLAQGDRASLQAKLREHDDALNALEGGPAPVGISAINGDSVELVPGTPVACGLTDGSVRRGWATSQAQSSILGLVLVGAAQTLEVRFVPDGALTLTTAQWDAVTGAAGGLTPGARYYLDDVEQGRFTTSPPTAPGTSIVAIGRALSEIVLVLHIQAYIVN